MTEHNFEIIKTMRKHKGKFIYFILDKKSEDAPGFSKHVGRIIWDGNKFTVDNK